jgi:hypothetical protein
VLDAAVVLTAGGESAPIVTRDINDLRQLDKGAVSHRIGGILFLR